MKTLRLSGVSALALGLAPAAAQIERDRYGGPTSHAASG
jgi:hypothetical protein